MKPFLGGAASANIWPYLPPKPPTNVVATDNGVNRQYNSGAVTVSFTPPVDGGPYMYYEAKSSPGNFTAISSSSPIEITGLQTGVSYTYTVKAIGYWTNGDSVASTPSTAVVATTVPQSPTIGSATAITVGRDFYDAGATVSFTPRATGGKATTYEVFSTFNSTVKVGEGTSSPVTASGMPGGYNVAFAVAARNSNGLSLQSGWTTSVLLTTKPSAPAVNASVTAAGAISASWDFSGYDGGAPISAISVNLYNASTGSVVATASGVSASSTSTTFTGLADGSYSVGVTGTNINGTSNRGMSSAISLVSSITATATAVSPTEIDTTWTGGPTGTSSFSFALTDLTDPGGNSWSGSSYSVGSSNFYNFTGVTPGHNYRFTVDAIGAGGVVLASGSATTSAGTTTTTTTSTSTSTVSPIVFSVSLTANSSISISGSWSGAPSNTALYSYILSTGVTIVDSSSGYGGTSKTWSVSAGTTYQLSVSAKDSSFNVLTTNSASVTTPSAATTTTSATTAASTTAAPTVTCGSAYGRVNGNLFYVGYSSNSYTGSTCGSGYVQQYYYKCSDGTTDTNPNYECTGGSGVGTTTTTAAPATTTAAPATTTAAPATTTAAPATTTAAPTTTATPPSFPPRFGIFSIDPDSMIEEL